MNQQMQGNMVQSFFDSKYPKSREYHDQVQLKNTEEEQLTQGV